MYKADNHFAGIPDIFDNSPHIALRFIRKGDSWHTCFASKNISQLGYTPEEFTSGSVNWIDLIHADDIITLNKQIDDYISLGIYSFKLYYRIIAKDGLILPVTEHSTIHPPTDDNIYVYDSFILNNTQAIESQQGFNDNSLKQAIINDIFISIQDVAPEKAIQLILSRTGAYLNVSRALLFKDSPDHTTCSIVYEWCNEYIKPLISLENNIHYDESMPDIYIALRTTGLLLINHGEIPENCKAEFEVEGLKSSAIFAIYLNGKHYGFVCFDDCIIERVWDESTAHFLKTIANIISNVLSSQANAEKLKKSHQRYVSVLDNIDAYIFVTEEPTDDIIFANRSFKKCFGDDCIGQSIQNFLNIDAALLTKSNISIIDNAEYPELYCPATKEWLSVIIENIEWINSNQATLFTCYDITGKKNFAYKLEQKIEERTHELKLMAKQAQKEKEKAEEATKAKSSFLANMSHELRTPMNAILGLSELLSESNLKGLHLEYVKNIYHSSTVLLKIINDILDISKLEANKVVLINNHYSLTKAIDHVTSLTHNMAKAKGLNFFITTHKDLPTYLFGDDIRLRQILINLLSNAIKYSDAGSIHFNINMDNQSIIFSIKDTGCGIKKEELENIFEPFTQADIQKNRGVQSTGLGLPICRSLAILMDATVTCKSEYGQGSTFILSIPKIIGDACKLSDDSKNTNQKFNAPDAHVLVVDDLDINLYVAKALLNVFNIKVSTASSGTEAIRLVQENTFDIIFMDHMMPEMDGIETTCAIRKLGGKFTEIPIIALSANAMPHSQFLFKQASMQDFISKPTELDKLQIILERWLPESKIIWK